MICEFEGRNLTNFICSQMSCCIWFFLLSSHLYCSMLHAFSHTSFLCVCPLSFTSCLLHASNDLRTQNLHAALALWPQWRTAWPSSSRCRHGERARRSQQRAPPQLTGVGSNTNICICWPLLCASNLHCNQELQKKLCISMSIKNRD